MSNQLWSWLLTIVGLTGFVLAGKRVWWCWYINLGCQGLWFTYAIITKQWGFVAAAIAYTIVFAKNALKWTRERQKKKKPLTTIPDKSIAWEERFPMEGE